ncbi:hypothetical protein [Halopseudomonas sp.]|uniref:hypothetical protein n=1 Tax=Halopseudomonas sp. TaxID=2901191 RepID=UPI00311FA063
MRKEWLLFLSATLHGCVFNSGSEFVSDAAPIGDLAAIAGCYQNAGETEEAGRARYLSQLFWVQPVAEHAAIAVIEVQVPEADRVRVLANSSEGATLQADYRQGEHFTFDGEKISLPGRWDSSFAAPADNPFIGLAHSSVTLRLDRSGNGVLTEGSSIAGTAFLIVPVAGSTSDSIRFNRLGDHCPDR